MKAFFSILILVMSWASFSFATIEKVVIYRGGSAFGSCGGGGGFMCIDRIKQEAERDAERSAMIDCRMRNGQLDTWSQSCNGFCNPSTLPYNAPIQSVGCNTNCSFYCSIEKN